MRGAGSSKLTAVAAVALGVAIIVACLIAFMGTVLLIGLTAGDSLAFLILFVSFVALFGSFVLFGRLLLPFARKRWSGEG